MSYGNACPKPCGAFFAALSAFLALPAAGQNVVEIRSADGVGGQQPRLGVTSGAGAEVRLFTTFNAQGNALTGVSSLSISGQLTSSVAPGTPPFIVASPTVVANLNADLLDGYHAGAFMHAATDLWVDSAGDAMSGTLTLPPDGLVAGTDQLVLAGGNVGIGTASPANRLTVAGTVESTTGGFRFPDGTVQTTAATGGTAGPFGAFKFTFSHAAAASPDGEFWTGDPADNYTTQILQTSFTAGQAGTAWIRIQGTSYAYANYYTSGSISISSVTVNGQPASFTGTNAAVNAIYGSSYQEYSSVGGFAFGTSASTSSSTNIRSMMSDGDAIIPVVAGQNTVVVSVTVTTTLDNGWNSGNTNVNVSGSLTILAP